MVFAFASVTAHEESSPGCDANEKLRIVVDDRDDGEHGVSGGHGCGGAQATCNRDDGFCDDDSEKTSTSGLGSCDGTAADDSATHVHCSIAGSTSGGEDGDGSGDLLDREPDTCEIRCHDSKSVPALTQQSMPSWALDVPLYIGIYDGQTAVQCVDGHCHEVQPDCQALLPTPDAPVTCQVTY